MPGMATSRTRHLVSAIDSEARKSSADENVCASKPNSFSKSGKDSRTDSSSSITVIRGSVTISYDSRLVFPINRTVVIEHAPIKAGCLSYFGIGTHRDQYRPIPKYRSILWCNRFPFLLVIYSGPRNEAERIEWMQYRVFNHCIFRGGEPL